MRSLSKFILVVMWLAGSAARAEPWIPRDVGRFAVLPPTGLLVLDRETNLLWMRDPSQFAGTEQWLAARRTCSVSGIAGRKGWRLPTVSEATSLFVETEPGSQQFVLPPGHPFRNLPGIIWTSTVAQDSEPNPGDPLLVRTVQIDGSIPQQVNTFPTTSHNEIWCVRGPQ